MSDAGKSILEGLRDAVAYAKGDTTRGRAHRVYVAEVDVRKVRMKLGFTQEQFAHTFGVSKATVRNWEQGRRRPEGPARVLLNVIKKHPDVVLDSLHEKRKRA